MQLIRKIINYYYLLRNRILKLFPKTIHANFLIVDNFFPNPYSDWRNNEIIYYLKKISNAKVITGVIRQNRVVLPIDYQSHVSNLLSQSRLNSEAILPLNIRHQLIAKLGYCIFLSNMRTALPYFEKKGIPFVFTLYPGGGFKLYDTAVHSDLLKIFNSSQFRHVIVNMPFIYNLIKLRYDLDENQISLIYGVPIHLPEISDKKPNISNRLNILFSSHKYSDFGVDKGLDVFVRVAKKLEQNINFHFTILGGFSEDDLVEKPLNLTIKKEMTPSKLAHEFLNYDVIISPNRSHVLSIGAFDGFPTSTVMHAANSGCLMMMTDEWNNAPHLGLVDNEDFCLINLNVDQIASKLLELESNRDSITKIAQSGKIKLLNLIDQNNQLPTRIKIINKYLA